MADSTTHIILAVFTGLVAVALLLQGFALLAISRRLRGLSARLEALSTKLTRSVDSLAVQTDSFIAVVKATAEKVHAVQESVSAITEVIHHRVVEVDNFLTEATDAGRLEIARFQDVIDTTSHKIEETIDTLQTAVVAPITEVYAIIRGIRSGLDVLFRRRRPSNRSQHDEEMFI